MSVSASHPFAYFRLFLAKHIGEILLFKTFLLQYTVNPVNNQELQANTPPDFGRNFSPASLYNVTSFHRW